MSNFGLSALKLCLTLALSLAAAACAVRADGEPPSAESEALRRAPGVGGRNHLDHAEVVVPH